MKINFSEQLSYLKELQDIDIKLEEINSKIDALPDRIAPLESAYNALKDELTNAKNELAELEKAKRHEEMELASTSEHARQRETKLYAIKTTKEYQAALKEIAETKKANKDREDKILTLMEKIEVLTQKITQLEKDTADKESAFQKENEIVKTEEGQLIEARREDEARRPAVLSKIDKLVLRKYDYVHERYAEALVHVKNGVCQGCSMNIPPQLVNEVLKSVEFKNCPSCHRLIYVVQEETTSAK